jgi:hypothetical protein
MPLAAAGLSSGKAVTLFANAQSLPDALPYPLALEVLSLNDLASALAWADYLAIDAPLAEIDTLRQALGLQPGAYPAPPTQVWIEAAFPCAGLAECGACAVRTRQGWKLACHDGPVFDFKELRLEDDPR